MDWGQPGLYYDGANDNQDITIQMVTSPSPPGTPGISALINPVANETVLELSSTSKAGTMVKILHPPAVHVSDRAVLQPAIHFF